MTVTSDHVELDNRLNNLRNRFAILVFLDEQGMNWINIAMSGNDNPFFARDKFIRLYNGENN